MNATTLNLLKAEDIAIELFEEAEERQLIVAGKDEETLNKEIFELAKELFSIEKHWHKRIVRSGANTLHPYKENPPNKIIQEDDILFFDFAWQETKEWFDTKTELKASELFAYAENKAKEYNWEFGGEIAGHLIGEFPHERLDPNSYQLYVHPDNHNNMFDLNAKGQKRNWILELHFVDNATQTQANSKKKNQLEFSTGYNFGYLKNLSFAPVTRYDYNGLNHQVKYTRTTKNDKLFEVQIDYLDSELLSTIIPEPNTPYSKIALNFSSLKRVYAKNRLTVHVGLQAQTNVTSYFQWRFYDFQQKFGLASRFTFQINDKQSLSSKLTIPLVLWRTSTFEENFYSLGKYQSLLWTMEYKYLLTKNFDLKVNYNFNYDRLQISNAYRELQHQLNLGVMKGLLDEDIYLNYQTKTDLELPFEEEWYVEVGGRTHAEGRHHFVARGERYAYDIQIEIDGRIRTGDGSKNEDHYCFGKRLNAPGAGKIVAVVNDIEDNQPGVTNNQVAGNYIIIDHLNGESSVLVHLKKGTIIVAVGDTVEKGQEVGKAGNSGASSAPHLHYHLQTTTNTIRGLGLPAQFQNYLKMACL
ncbi:putative metalloprotease [Nymphon striatum]|nr:putative metalloprotease [Nymphon striatum]